METPRLRISSHLLRLSPGHGPTALTKRKPFIHLCGYCRPPSKESKDVFPCNVTGTQRQLAPGGTLGSSFYRALGAPSEDLGQNSVTFEERRPVAVSCLITLSMPSFPFSLRPNNPGSCGDVSEASKHPSVGTGRVFWTALPQAVLGGQPTLGVCARGASLRSGGRCGDRSWGVWSSATNVCHGFKDRVRCCVSAHSDLVRQSHFQRHEGTCLKSRDCLAKPTIQQEWRTLVHCLQAGPFRACREAMRVFSADTSRVDWELLRSPGRWVALGSLWGCSQQGQPCWCLSPFLPLSISHLNFFLNRKRKLWCIYMMEYCSAIKNEEILPFTTR